MCGGGEESTGERGEPCPVINLSGRVSESYYFKYSLFGKSRVRGRYPELLRL
jgi:hypothetical protein